MVLVIVQLLVFASLVLSAYMIVVTLERCRSEKRYGFVYCIVAIFFYTLGYFIEISSGTLGGGIVAIKIMYIGGCFMSPFFFFFVADFCDLRIPKKYYTIPLLIIPVLFYLVVFTFDSHQMLYRSFHYETENQLLGMTIEPGPLYLIGTFYPLLCIGLTFIILLRSIVKQSRGRRLSLVLLLISALAPLIANFAYVGLSFFFTTAVAGLNFTAFVMIITNFIFFYNVIRNDLFDLAPKAHAITMDLIRDSFVILDWDMSYMGSNKKALELFPGLAELQKGVSILDLKDWPAELLSDPGDGKKTTAGRQEIEFSLPHIEEKIFSGWTNQVSSESGVTLGWVILIQDITETVSLIRNIRAQRDEIAVMRDNLKEGIFLMDRELKIQDSYSRAMEDVLSGKNLQGRCFTDLLSRSIGPKELASLADYFIMIMDRTVDPEMLEEINPLNEFSYISTETGEQKTLRCLFAPVDQGGGEVFVMGTIQDITAETILKRQLAEEEERRLDEMRSLFELIQADPVLFVTFNDDTDQDFRRIKETLLDKKINDKQRLINIYQSLHAVKSNAVIIGLSSYAEKLHILEGKIKELQEKEELNPAELSRFTEELERRMEDKNKFLDILKQLQRFGSASAGIKSDEEIFLDSLKQACQKVAEDEGKKAVLLTNIFDVEAIKLGPRKVMNDILTQLIRNAVHHGIEKPDERLAKGKTETGKITLSVRLQDSCITMRLEDDGRGLDFDRIIEAALARGILKKPPADGEDPKLILKLIFSSGFSSSETEDIHAGRGVGLDLVRDRLREVNGKVVVSGKKDRGMVFNMKIPLKG